MPELDLGDWRNGLDAFTPVRVFGTMLFPKDHERREEYLAVESALAQGSPTEVTSSLYRVLAHARHAYLTERKKPAERGYLAGEILVLVRNIAEYHEGSPRGEASVSKAIELLAAAKKNAKRFPGGLIASNPETLRQAWSKFKSVSHLWFAVSCWVPGETVLEASETALPNAAAKALTSEHFLAILAVAEDMRQFGETHATRAKQAGKPKSILPPEETWKVPAELPLPPINVSAGIKPLSGKLDQWFQEYRARVRY